MVQELAVFALGLVALVLGSREVILRGVRLARLTGISELAIGFILLAIGTSLPELAVAVFSSFAGESQLALGTLAGANIHDATLVIGAAALFGAVAITRKDRMIAGAAIFAMLIAGAAVLMPALGAGFGLFALLVFGFFVWDSYKQGYIISAREKIWLKTPQIVISGALLLAGIVLVLLGASWVVDSAASIARSFGIPEVLIGGLIISLGTTLPELSVSIQALRSNRSGLAIGTIAGSLVANLGLVLGLAVLVRPIVLSSADKLWLAGSIAACILFTWASSRKALGLREGLVLVTCWAAIIGSLLVYSFQ